MILRIESKNSPKLPKRMRCGDFIYTAQFFLFLNIKNIIGMYIKDTITISVMKFD